MAEGHFANPRPSGSKTNAGEVQVQEKLFGIIDDFWIDREYLGRSVVRRGASTPLLLVLKWSDADAASIPAASTIYRYGQPLSLPIRSRLPAGRWRDTRCGNPRLHEGRLNTV